MELLLGVLGLFISSILSIIFSSRIINVLGDFLSKFDLQKKCNIEGEWLAEFSFREDGEEKTFKEAIRLVKRLGKIHGYNIPHDENHQTLKKVDGKKPLRVRAVLVDNRFLSGNWFHPDKTSRFHGSFQLLLRLNVREMSGLWTGYSEHNNSICEGDWKWKRID